MLTALISQLSFNCHRKQNWRHTKFPLILLPNNKRRTLRILDFHIVHDVFIERNHSVNTRWYKYFYKVQIPSVQQANSFLLWNILFQRLKISTIALCSLVSVILGNLDFLGLISQLKWWKLDQIACLCLWFSSTLNCSDQFEIVDNVQ